MITLLESDPVTVEVGVAYTDAGADASADAGADAGATSGSPSSSSTREYPLNVAAPPPPLSAAPRSTTLPPRWDLMAAMGSIAVAIPILEPRLRSRSEATPPFAPTMPS